MVLKGLFILSISTSTFPTMPSERGSTVHLGGGGKTELLEFWKCLNTPWCIEDLLSAEWHVNRGWRCESASPSEYSSCRAPQRQQCSGARGGLGAPRRCWTALQRPPRGILLICIHRFYALAPAEKKNRPRLARQCHGMAAATRAPAEVWERPTLEWDGRVMQRAEQSKKQIGHIWMFNVIETEFKIQIEGVFT